MQYEETKAAAQYTGEVLIDNLYVNAAPAVEAPVPAERDVRRHEVDEQERDRDGDREVRDRGLELEGAGELGVIALGP